MNRNKRTRKMFAGILAVGLIASAVVPAYATEAGDPNEEKTVMSVGYQEASTFTLNIPSAVVLKEDEEVLATVGLNAINVGTKEKVQIKVKEGISDGKVTLKDVKDEANIRTSLVSLTSGASTGIDDTAVVAEFVGTNTNPTEGGTLYFAGLGDVPAGTYSGTIVFVASIVDK